MQPSGPTPSGNPRLRGFLTHLIGYFAVMIVPVAVNFTATPDRPWFVWPLVAWMAPLAVHAAYAMHLFGKPRE
jgi:2TM domain